MFHDHKQAGFDEPDEPRELNGATLFLVLVIITLFVASVIVYFWA